MNQVPNISIREIALEVEAAFSAVMEYDPMLGWQVGGLFWREGGGEAAQGQLEATQGALGLRLAPSPVPWRRACCMAGAGVAKGQRLRQGPATAPPPPAARNDPCPQTQTAPVPGPRAAGV